MYIVQDMNVIWNIIYQGFFNKYGFGIVQKIQIIDFYSFKINVTIYRFYRQRLIKKDVFAENL